MGGGRWGHFLRDPRRVHWFAQKCALFVQGHGSDSICVMPCMLASVGQPSLHGYDACMVYWIKGALQEKLPAKFTYRSARNPFERFRGFSELFSRFEFEFCRRDFFFERFEYLVCSKFNHVQRDCTCACAVACLHPHNSFSNVVVSLTIHDHIFLHGVFAG